MAAEVLPNPKPAQNFLQVFVASPVWIHRIPSKKSDGNLNLESSKCKVHICKLKQMNRGMLQRQLLRSKAQAGELPILQDGRITTYMKPKRVFRATAAPSRLLVIQFSLCMPALSPEFRTCRTHSACGKFPWQRNLDGSVYGISRTSG